MFFDIDTEVLYQKAYVDNIDNLRLFIRAMFNIMKNVLTDNYHLH